MMRARMVTAHAFGAAAIAACAPGADAGGGIAVTLRFDLDGDPLTARDVNLGDLGDGRTASWTVWGSFTGFPPGSYFGGFVGRFAPSREGVGHAASLTNLMAGAGAPALADGAAVEGVNIFNSALLGTDDPGNPLAIFAFDLVIDPEAEVGPLAYWAEGEASVFWDPFWDFQDPPGFAVVSDRLVIPAPGSWTAVVGVIAATRRRRAGRPVAAERRTHACARHSSSRQPAGSRSRGRPAPPARS
jgi:hypothetical protein